MTTISRLPPNIYPQSETKTLGYGLGFDESLAVKIINFFQCYRSYLKIEDFNDVFDYFIDNNDKHELLLDITQKVVKSAISYFGENTRIVLEVNHDPEYSDEYLVFYIRPIAYPSDFSDKLVKMRSEFYDIIREHKLWILITTDRQLSDKR